MMMEPIWAYFLVGALACFLGTVPIGPINLAVVKATVDHDRRRGAEIALAASLVEIGEAAIAIFFGMAIGEFLRMNAWPRLTLALAFFALAAFLLTRKPKSAAAPPIPESGLARGACFRRGLLIAALNPQAVPFWILALTTIRQYFALDYQDHFLAAFLAGVFLGKLTALAGYAALADYLKSRLHAAGKRVNQALALVLILVGISQLRQIVF